MRALVVMMLLVAAVGLVGCGGDNLELCDGCGTRTPTPTPTSTAETPTPTATGATPTATTTETPRTVITPGPIQGT